MRLIDANTLGMRIQSLKEKYTHKNELLYTVEEKAIAEAMKLLDSAPTVEIPSEETNGAIWQYAEENDISKWIIHGVLKIIQASINK